MVGNFRQSATQVRPITNVKPVVSGRPTTVLSGRPVSNVMIRPVTTQIRPVGFTLEGVPANQQKAAAYLEGLKRQAEMFADKRDELTNPLAPVTLLAERLNDPSFWLTAGAYVAGLALIFITVNGMVRGN